ncbi:hypothetical protein CC86DRAFT_408752 [Ophiobolus disseminans]|uniref:Uncharacterized protein n=1 Tax=Ophiobolus disseminans TaxID=1469910 RepID=A0A6A6ZTG3_9PLEO|nr:hypothetical protein CC86DRAFT_408752 [Ophiobolus disseminans]
MAMSLTLMDISILDTNIRARVVYFLDLVWEEATVCFLGRAWEEVARVIHLEVQLQIAGRLWASMFHRAEYRGRGNQEGVEGIRSDRSLEGRRCLMADLRGRIVVPGSAAPTPTMGCNHSTPPPLELGPGGRTLVPPKSYRNKHRKHYDEEDYMPEYHRVEGSSRQRPSRHIRRHQEQANGGVEFDPFTGRPSQRAQSMPFNFPQPAHPSARHGSGRHDQPRNSAPAFGAPGMQSYPHPSRHGVSAHDWANPASHHPPAPSAHQPSHHQRVRKGKLPEGARLPTGVQDPLATVSDPKPFGHFGLREHVPGMSKLQPEKHGRADDPNANWKVQDEIRKLQEEQARGGGGRGSRSGRHRSERPQ